MSTRESVRSCVRVYQCVSAVRAVEVAVFVCWRSSSSHVTGGRIVKFVRLALKVLIILAGICGCNPAVTVVCMKLELSLWWKNKDCVRFGIPGSVTVKITAFWNVTLCSLVARCHLGGTLLLSSSGYFSYIGWAGGLP